MGGGGGGHNIRKNHLPIMLISKGQLQQISSNHSLLIFKIKLVCSFREFAMATFYRPSRQTSD